MTVVLSHVLRRLGCAWALIAGLALAGCAGTMPVAAPRPPTQVLQAPPDAPLSRLAADSGVPEGRSGFWPLPQGAYALDARLALIRNARTSLDLQYYLLANDAVGRLVMRELREAAERGVRVRLLVDDLYTQNTEPALLALQSFANVEVRVFNPFTFGRGNAFGRLLNFLGEFRRINHRMHNKLFIADGAVAIVGGRNLADEYFLRGKEANFLDMDLLVAGALTPQLGVLFDRYWNSEQVFPLAALHPPEAPAAELQTRFDALVPRAAEAMEPPEGPDNSGEPPLSRALALGRQRFVVADARCVADLPAKARVDAPAPPFTETVTWRFIQTLQTARSEIIIFSPYFVPGKQGLARLREARDAGIEVRVITNDIRTSDEPLVNVGYRSYREELLAMGVKLYELSADRIDHDPLLKKVLGSSHARLHAKMGFVDRRTVMVGSMNVDLRSAYTNTEIGVAVDSPALAKLILDAYRADNFSGVYEVQLKPDGKGLQWVGLADDGQPLGPGEEPSLNLWERFKLWVQFLFVSEDLL